MGKLLQARSGRSRRNSAYAPGTYNSCRRCANRRAAHAGNKNDRVDARKLSDLLRAGLITPVYHGESGIRTLRELSRSYLTVSKDLTRVMNRLKGLYRSWAIPCGGQQVYSSRQRATWLESRKRSKLSKPRGR
jgi:hypothetical protein